jgi:hypothetical protein
MFCAYGLKPHIFVLGKKNTFVILSYYVYSRERGSAIAIPLLLAVSYFFPPLLGGKRDDELALKRNYERNYERNYKRNYE